MQANQGGGKALVVAGEPAEAAGPGEAAFDDPARGSSTKPLLASGRCDHDEMDAVLLRRRCRIPAGVAGIGIEDFDASLPSPPGPAWPARRPADAPPRWRASPPAPTACPCYRRPHGPWSRAPACARPRQRAVRSPPSSAACDYRQSPCWAGVASSCCADQQAQVLDDGFETAGGDPAARLLIHRLPRRKVDGSIRH